MEWKNSKNRFAFPIKSKKFIIIYLVTLGEMNLGKYEVEIMVTDLQKKTAQAIVNIFETGRVRGDYGMVTQLEGDRGHLTYGRSQTTLASGNLYLLIKAYCERKEAALGGELSGYLPALKKIDLRLDGDQKLQRLLAEAGDDPVMRDVQDAFFDRVYWNPAIKRCEAMDLQSALSVTVIYDSVIHGSVQRMIERTNEQLGSPIAAGERTWIAGYVGERRNWLAGHKNALLRRTVYRMEAFDRQIDAENWDLRLPVRVRGVEIREEDFAESAPAVRAWAGDKNESILCKTSPLTIGRDVKAIQEALQRQGFDIEADGKFGKKTEEAVRQFQRKNGLAEDGIVGNATRMALLGKEGGK